jgi:ubiquinone/menaquinone biosynthesis C-methylase UbiE
MTDQKQAADVLNEWRETAKYWVKHRETIRAMFKPVTEALIAQAGIAAGHSVLDVAGGAGEPSLTIAEAVGPGGSVTCTDPIAEMIAAAQEEANRRGLKNVQFRQCTADSLAFADESFDQVVSRFGIMFFPEPVVASRELLRVAKRGGVLAFAVWHRNELNPFNSVLTEIMARYVDSPPADPDAPGAFRYAQPGKLANILIEAGATATDEQVLEFDIAAPITREEYWNLRSETSDTLRQKLSRLSDDQLRQIKSEVVEAVEEFFPDNQMRFPGQTIIVSGRKPN